jgi:hypothetical protein
MAPNRVVLYFEKEEQALLFTLAASSTMSLEQSVPNTDTAKKLAAELCKATRVTAEGIVNNR